MQRKFRNEYGRPPPDVKRIKAWYSKFVETGSVGDLHRSGRPSVSDETVDAVREAFQSSPGKSTRRRVRTERDGTRAETRFGLPAKRTSTFISAGVSVQSSTGFLAVRVGRERL